MRIIILGPPGSGKGTVSERLEKEFGWFHLSAGQLLREEVEKGTSLGKEIHKFIDKGKLVPDQFVTEIVKLELQQKKHFILDGFPRTVQQAEAAHITVDKVLLLDISEDVAVERFAGRRKCPQGHGYHLIYLPPRKKRVCDIDGLPLTRRADDASSVVRKRFKIYNQQTKPLIKYYQKKGQLCAVDAAKTPQETYKEVKKALKR